jgi:hypothetical protein
MPKEKKVTIGHAIKYYPTCWVEDRKLQYRTKNQVEGYIELSPDEFALWELGFQEGHNAGTKYAIDSLSVIRLKLNKKELCRIYG